MHNHIKAALLLGSLAAGSAMAAVSPDQAADAGQNPDPGGRRDGRQRRWQHSRVEHRTYADTPRL